MKSVAAALVLIAPVCHAQVGARVNEITVHKALGAPLILKHCEVTEVKPEGVKVKHDDGSYVVPIADLPEEWKAAVAQQKLIAEAKAQEMEERAKAEVKKNANKSPSALFASEAPVDLENFTKPDPGRIGIPGTQKLRVTGRVFTVLPPGVILQEWENETLEPYGAHFGGNIYRDQMLYVEGPTDLVDGDRFKGVVYPAGKFQYHGNTMHRYATSSEDALKLTRGVSAKKD